MNGGANKHCVRRWKNEKITIRGEVYSAFQSNSEKLIDRHFFVKGSTLLRKGFLKSKRRVIRKTDKQRKLFKRTKRIILT